MTNVRTRKGYNEAPLLEPVMRPDGQLSRAWQDWTDEVDRRVADFQAPAVEAVGAPTQTEFNNLVAKYNALLTEMVKRGLMKES